MKMTTTMNGMTDMQDLKFNCDFTYRPLCCNTLTCTVLQVRYNEDVT